MKYSFPNINFDDIAAEQFLANIFSSTTNNVDLTEIKKIVDAVDAFLNSTSKAGVMQINEILTFAMHELQNQDKIDINFNKAVTIFLGDNHLSKAWIHIHSIEVSGIDTVTKVALNVLNSDSTLVETDLQSLSININNTIELQPGDWVNSPQKDINETLTASMVIGDMKVAATTVEDIPIRPIDFV